MYPKQHIILGGIFSLVLFFLFPSIGITEALLVFLSSVFIDVDHYFAYAVKKKDLSLKKSYRWFLYLVEKNNKLSPKERKKCHYPLCVFHNIETLIVVTILGFFVSKYFFFIILGMIFHLILDYIEIFKEKARNEKISLIYNLIIFRKLKHIDDL